MKTMRTLLRESVGLPTATRCGAEKEQSWWHWREDDVIRFVRNHPRMNEFAASFEEFEKRIWNGKVNGPLLVELTEEQLQLLFSNEESILRIKQSKALYSIVRTLVSVSISNPLLPEKSHPISRHHVIVYFLSLFLALAKRWSCTVPRATLWRLSLRSFSASSWRS